MDYKTIISDLKNKIYKPIYFLMGEEAFYIEKISDYIEKNVLTDTEKSFNQTIVYGRDSDLRNIIDLAKRFPMMSNHQVVIVKEGQDIKKLDDLIYYVQQPLSSTILVINYKYKTLDKRTKLYKALDQKGAIFTSDKLKDYQVPGWIKEYLKEKKTSIENDACELLNENLGNDLAKISNELDKLMITLPKGRMQINSDDIEKNIGISKEYNSYELSKAIGSRDILKANRIVLYFAKEPKNTHISMIIATLFGFFSKLMIFHCLPVKDKNSVASALKLNPYVADEYMKTAKIYNNVKVMNVLALLREFDLKSKGSGNSSTSDGELLKELVYRIMH